MAYSVISKVITQNTDHQNVTSGAIDTTNADLIIVFAFSRASGAGTVTFTDSKSNTGWIALTTAKLVNTWGEYLTIYYKQSPAVGTGHTFSLACSDWYYPTVGALAVSGSAATPVDAENTHDANTNNVTTLTT